MTMPPRVPPPPVPPPLPGRVPPLLVPPVPPSRPIPGAESLQLAPRSEEPEAAPSRNRPVLPTAFPIAKDLPPWDLVPSDLLLVRRRPQKK